MAQIQDRLKPLVKLLSWIPNIILFVLALSLILYIIMPIAWSIRVKDVQSVVVDYIVRLMSIIYYSYFPSQLNLFNILCLIVLAVFLLYMMSPLLLGYNIATAYVAGIALYFGGQIITGFWLGLAGLTGGTAPIIPNYGFGIGDFFIAGLIFLVSMSGKAVSLIWRWASSQTVALLAIILAVNILALVSMWIDKKQSTRPEAYRVPEKSLLKYSLLCGGIGIIIGAILFRHKTKHKGLLTSVVVATIAGVFILLGGLVR